MRSKYPIIRIVSNAILSERSLSKRNANILIIPKHHIGINTCTHVVKGCRYKTRVYLAYCQYCSFVSFLSFLGGLYGSNVKELENMAVVYDVAMPNSPEEVISLLIENLSV